MSYWSPQLVEVQHDSLWRDCRRQRFLWIWKWTQDTRGAAAVLALLLSWVPWDSHCWLIFPLHKYNGFKTVSSNEKYFIKDLHFKCAKDQYLRYDWLCYSSLAIQTNEIKTLHLIWGVETEIKLLISWQILENHKQHLVFLINVPTKKPSL